MIINDKKSLAERADKYSLYEQSVQCVEAEIDMVDHTFYQLRGRHGSFLREDFCGTAKTSCEWIQRRKTNHAIAIDLDPKVLEWGEKHNIFPLNKAEQTRIELKQADVLAQTGEPVDMVLAMNFSYQLFKTRSRLKEYFQSVRQGLTEDGIFFLDAYGGHDSWRTIEEETEFDDFSYFWDQAKYNPINGHMLCHIHFRFPDGSNLDRAFTYNWRLWTLPELREILEEAGFSKVTIWWEGTDEKSGEGDGTYFATDQGDDDPSWIVYLSAEK
jgi:cyclopropane fatty-acyl-phospholipid synthase-like methyltransferase